MAKRMTLKEKKKAIEEVRKKEKDEKRMQLLKEREWYCLRSILGYKDCFFYFLLGGREAGKSYAVTDFFVKQYLKYQRPFTWLRLSETSAKKLLQNNAEKLIDPDIRRKYNLDLVTNGNNVYIVNERTKPNKKGETKIKKKSLFARVFSIATFYNDKGSGLFDKDFLLDPNMYYNICMDEMNREKSEKNSFDIVYSFTNQIENLVRSTKTRLRIICIGNTLEEASDLLCAFNFIPEDFGRYKLKSKKAVIEYIPPTEAYLERRKGTVADILMPNASTFTNKIDTDDSLVYKGRLRTPLNIIKFSKNQDDWFTLYDNNVIRRYNKENKTVIAMKPYLDEVFNGKLRDQIILTFDNRGYKYKDLITFKMFQKNIALLKPRGN
jgi:hypothetical protein